MEQAFFRTIWISDTHLGGRNSQSRKLLQFLLTHESDYLYLVGDIVDFWKLRRSWFWPKINDQIISVILKKARKGTRIFYLPGNHDQVFQPYSGTTINGISVINEVVHESADGNKYLVMHGDKFDCVIQKKKWLAGLGSILYDNLLTINRWYNVIRVSLFGLPYHSISASIKHRVKKAVNYIGNFEEALINEAAVNNVDGLICGHIHHAAIRDINGVLYSNSGDWVESCTALVENTNGTLGVIEWQEGLSTTELNSIGAHYEDRYRNGCMAPTN
ncbi:MAG: UDP-2,3-diacylglucosamine diphosphatase [Desulfocapsaceae bacterium]|jgi:UDP-2,3-diacylglucosamine pyrophosphatase LpxH|nr:UDP-2,3-diacylglucosamine diphosphatase [Desulfocapsaceae bacterium]